jgi:hypothetical protein
MPYTLLPLNLHAAADRAKTYFCEEEGLRKVVDESQIEDNVNWRPTFKGDTTDYHILCVEVTDGGYNQAFDSAIMQCINAGLPVRFYVAYRSADITGDKFKTTFGEAQSRGVGVLEVRDRSCHLVHRANALSLAAVRKIAISSYAKKYRLALRDAQTTFLTGDPAKGCSRIYEEIEALSRKLVARAVKEGWWTTNLRMMKDPWATVMTQFNSGVNFAAMTTRCPKMTKGILNRIVSLTDQRNEAAHKPKSRAELMARDATLRTRFENASDIFLELDLATRPLHL